MTIKLHDIKRLIAAMTMGLVVAFAAMAQADAAMSHFWTGQGYYNPAAAGNLDATINLQLGSRMQWVDFRRAPMTFYITADMPYKLLEQRLGVGVKAEFERIGLYTNTRIGAQIAYKRKIGKCMLSVGVQPGVFSQTFRGREAITTKEQEEVPDEAIKKEDVSGTAFDANVGVYFTHPRFWAGFSVTHVTSPSIELKVSRESIDYYEFNVSRSYYFMGGGNIPINNTLFDIQPAAMFATDLKAWTAQIAARLRYNRMFSIGAGYRYKDAVTAFIGVNLKDAYIGYAYDYPVSAISKATFGSHEVFINYTVKLNNREKNKNKQKSVRLM